MNKILKCLSRWHCIEGDNIIANYLAHIRYDENGKEHTQTVKEHSLNTALIAKERLEPAELGEMGYLAGLVHDMGKCKAEFQSYLRQNAAGEELCRKKVIHTFAGVRRVSDGVPPHTGRVD